MAQEILSTLGDTTGNILFYNVSEEFYASLQQPILSLGSPSRSNLVPFIFVDGQWRWLGLSNDVIEEALNVIVRNRFITTDFLRTHLEMSDSQLEVLKAVLDANPAYFTYDYRKGVVQSVFNINGLLNEIVERESKFLTKTFLDHGLLLDGHFLLPSGHHTNKCALTSQIPQHPDLFERIYSQVARYVWASAPNVIITSSLLSFMIGERLRKEQKKTVLNTFGYPIPRPRYGDSIENGERVFILSDIYSTGSAFNHIRKQVLANEGIIVGAVSVVDAHRRGVKDDVKSPIKLHVKLRTEQKCLDCKKGETIQLLDPFSCLPFQSPVTANAPKGLLEPDEFWNLLREKDAIKGTKENHLIYNGKHFTFYIESRKILRDPATSRELAARALSAIGPNFDAIVIPKNEGALLLAHAIQEYLQHHFGKSPDIITCAKDHEKNAFAIPALMHKSLRNSSLLVLDDGVYTGNNLLGLHYAVKSFKPKKIKYLVFIDRLFGTDRQNFKEILGPDYFCLFHLAIPVYREWDCPVCFEEESQAFYTRGQQDAPSEQMLPSRSAGPRIVTKLHWEANRR